MSTIDLTTILGNISESLLPVQLLVSGLGYLLGILFVMSGLMKLTKVSNRSQERVFTPIAYILGGSALLYLPSSMAVLSDTLFGSGNILQYTNYNTFSSYDSVKIMIQTAGLIWFVRGTVLLIHASEPGQQHGPKGALFVLSGIMAMNFDYTVNAINTMFTHFIGVTSKMF